MDVDQSGDEVSVSGRRGGEQRHPHRADHRVRGVQDCAGVGQYVGSCLDLPLVDGAGWPSGRQHRRPAPGRHRVGRVVLSAPEASGPKWTSPWALRKELCVHGPTSRRGGRRCDLAAAAAIAWYWSRVPRVKMSYQPPMWNVSARTTSYVSAGQGRRFRAASGGRSIAAMTSPIMLPGRSPSCRSGSRSNSSPEASRAVVSASSRCSSAARAGLSRNRRRSASAPIWT
jgi:hypothetical protein